MGGRDFGVQGPDLVLIRGANDELEVEPCEKSAAEVVPIATAIGGPEARVGTGMVEPSAATCGHRSSGPSIEERGLKV